MKVYSTVFALVMAAASPALAQMPSPPDPWVAPVGIPTPPFGLTEQAPANPTAYCAPGWGATPKTEVAACWYVDNTHPSATDTRNVAAGDFSPRRGTPDRPRMTLPPNNTVLAAGTYVEVRGGPYAARTLVATGTAVAPVFIKGIGNPVCNTGTMQFRGTAISRASVDAADTYLIVEGIIFDNCRVAAGTGTYNPALPEDNYNPVSFFALRRSTVRHYEPGSNSSAISPQGDNIVIFANEIWQNGDPDGIAEEDVHAMKPDTGDSYIWYLDNHVHHNGGDSIQIGDASSDEPWAHHVFVGRNEMHDDRENAVDIKKARDVIVSQNTGYAYEATDTSGGTGMVAHDQGEWLWFIYNTVHTAIQGIICSGASNYHVIGNVLYNIKHDPTLPYDSDDPFRSTAIRTSASSQHFHVANTIWDSDSGVAVFDPSYVVNNLIGPLSVPTAAHHVAFDSGDVGAMTFSNNLMVGTPRVRHGSDIQAGMATCVNCVNVATAAGVQVLNEGGRNYSLLETSPAVGAGLANAVVYDRFTTRYGAEYPGLTIARDRAGNPRPNGGTWDIGAFEFWSGIPPSMPTGLTVTPVP